MGLTVLGRPHGVLLSYIYTCGKIFERNIKKERLLRD